MHANVATSVDGKLSTVERRQVTLSGPDDFERVDRLRASVDAILVGIDTVLADDPSLTVADGVDRDDQPARVVADSTGRTPTDTGVLTGAGSTYVLVSQAVTAERLRSLEDAGASVIITPGTDRVDLGAGLGELEALGIERLLVEGGGELLFSLFAAGLVDELTVFISPTVLGGRDAPTLADGDGFIDRFPGLTLEAVDRLDRGLVCRYEVAGWTDAAGAG